MYLSQLALIKSKKVYSCFLILPRIFLDLFFESCMKNTYLFALYVIPTAEYAYTLRVTEKSDIYSFGVVILELVTGRPPIDPKFGDKDLAAWVCTSLDQKGPDSMLDPNLDSSYKEQISRVLDIGLLCISPLPLNRPSMRSVVKMLQETGADNKPKIAKKDGKVSSYYNKDNFDQEV